MAAKTVNVGLIGTKFMGKAHSNAYLKVAKFFDVQPQPIMKAICGRHADETAEFAEVRPDGARAIDALRRAGSLGALTAELPAAARGNVERFASELARRGILVRREQPSPTPVETTR